MVITEQSTEPFTTYDRRIGARSLVRGRFFDQTVAEALMVALLYWTTDLSLEKMR